MSKNTNLSFLTDFLTADIVNSRVGMNNVSPQSTFDVTGTGKFSGILTLGSTVSNGTYTYTLPSATGTLALTSDIPVVTGYVPYTGATQAVNLGYNQLLASTLSINGDSLTGGSYLGFKHSTSVNTGNNGYTSIYTFGTNTIGFKSISGATTRDFSFSMASITPGVPGGRTYTLPDADGTIALTSQIPTNPVGGTGTTNYLPKFTGASTIGNSLVFDDGTNVGINTASPEGKLTVVGTSAQPPTSGTTANSLLQLKGSLGNELNIGSNTVAGNYGAYIQASDNNLAVPYQLNLQPTGGNVIIGGYTDAGFKLDVNGTGRFTQNVTIGAATAATNVKLIFNGVASKAAGIEFHQSGTPQWYIGNGIASEDNNFELYNSNGTMAMKIIKSTNTINFIGSNEVMNISGTNATSAYTGYYYNTSTLVGYIGNGTSILSGAASSDFIFRSQGALVYATNGNNERMRITSGGSLQINYNPGGGDLYFRDTTNGAVMFYIIPATYVGTAPFNSNRLLAANSSHISFETGGAERVRITNDNNVLFNTTSTSSTNTSSFIFRSGTGAYSGVMIMNHATTNNTGAGFIDCYYNTSYIGGIGQNGASNVSFLTSSDYRLKEDLKDFDGLNLISSLKVYDFKWKTEDSRMYGLLAHELQEVIPYTVSGDKDEIKENGKIKVQVVDYSKLVPVLIKAIQEQQEQIDKLKNL